MRLQQKCTTFTQDTHATTCRANTRLTNAVTNALSRECTLAAAIPTSGRPIRGARATQRQCSTRLPNYISITPAVGVVQEDRFRNGTRSPGRPHPWPRRRGDRPTPDPSPPYTPRISIFREPA